MSRYKIAITGVVEDFGKNEQERLKQELKNLLAYSRPLNIEVEEENGRIGYCEARCATVIQIEFSKKVSKYQVQRILEYFGEINYNPAFRYVEWFNGKTSSMSPNTVCYAVAYFNPQTCQSTNWKNHFPLEKLFRFLSEGTPKRITRNKTRAYSGVGNVVAVVSF